MNKVVFSFLKTTCKIVPIISFGKMKPSWDLMFANIIFIKKTLKTSKEYGLEL
jgi:hypothetical protein